MTTIRFSLSTEMAVETGKYGGGTYVENNEAKLAKGVWYGDRNNLEKCCRNFGLKQDRIPLINTSGLAPPWSGWGS